MSNTVMRAARKHPKEAFARPPPKSVGANKTQKRQKVSHEYENENKQQCPLLFATDFGTTFSAMAYTDEGDRKGIKVIKNYPGDPLTVQGEPRLDVPTESWYPEKEVLAEMALPATTRNERMTGTNAPRGNANGDGDGTGANVPPERPEERKVYWGYEVQEGLAHADAKRSQFNAVARSKLLLDVSKETESVRDDLQPVLKQLTTKRFIQTDEDVIAQYLHQLFLHAKEELLRLDELPANRLVRHVLCVPVIWTDNACQTMLKAMKAAIEGSSFGSSADIFLVQEPEAAAAFMVNEPNSAVDASETFVLLDAGGGTVDISTYTVTETKPLGLKREEVAATGGLYGSSYVNEAFQRHLYERIKDQAEYVERDGITIQGIIDQQTVLFENKWKRQIDFNKANMKDIELAVYGVRKDTRRRFKANRVVLNRDDLWGIFQYCLEGISKLLNDQLKLGKDAGLIVKKVRLIGGFSNSPALRSYLHDQQSALRKISSSPKLVIQHVVNRELVPAAMAHGALLRTIDKDDELERISLCSYGFLFQETYDPVRIPGHNEATSKFDKKDGITYVDAISWEIKKGDVTPVSKEYEISTFSLFPKMQKQFVCKQTLYMSETSTESHYELTHPKNKGTKVAGVIKMDVTDLVRSRVVKAKRNGGAEKTYRVDYVIILSVQGRNLHLKGQVEGETRAETKVKTAARLVRK